MATVIFENPPHHNLATNALPEAFASADLNGDGKPDLVTATYLGSNNLWISLGNGDGTFQSAIKVPLAGMPLALTVVDFNGDGKPDIALIVSNQGAADTLQVLFGNRDGTFQHSVTIASANFVDGLASGDFKS